MKPEDLPPTVEADEGMMQKLADPGSTLGAGHVMAWAHGRIRYLEARCRLLGDIADAERGMCDMTRDMSLGEATRQ